MTLRAQLWAVLGLWACLWAVGVNGQADGSFWWLNNTTPSPSASSPTPTPSGTHQRNCQCVPFYQCVDGVITTSGEGLLDIRALALSNSTKPVTNVANCPELLDICCALPEDTGSPAVTHKPVSTTTLPPDTPCECVSLFDCKDPNRLVSDGKGTANPIFGSSFTHSKCGDSEVCCAAEPTAMPLEEDDDCICVPQDLCGEDGHVITDGSGIINPRFGPDRTPMAPLPTGHCSRRNDVCCLKPPPTTTEKPHNAACGLRNVGGVRVSVFVALLLGLLCGRW